LRTAFSSGEAVPKISIFAISKYPKNSPKRPSS